MRRTLSVCAIALLYALPAPAQERGTELGLGITSLGVIVTGGESVFQFVANQQFVSVGLYLTPTIAVQPATAISVLSGGGVSVAAIRFGLALPIHTRPTWGHSGLYFAPSAGVLILSADASGVGQSASQFGAGLGVGSKIPIADAVSLSISGNFNYSFRNETFNDVVWLNTQLGIAVFLR